MSKDKPVGGRHVGELMSRSAHGIVGSLSNKMGGDAVPVDLDVAQALDIWRGALVASVRADTPDLTARQMAILLLIYRDQTPATVRGLAKALNLRKPAVTRAIDRLSTLGLVRRRTDDSDRRNVLLQRTVTGSVFLSEFADLIKQAGKASGRIDPASAQGRLQ